MGRESSREAPCSLALAPSRCLFVHSAGRLVAGRLTYTRRVREILFVFPTLWDRSQLEACRLRWQERFRVRLTEPVSEEVPYDFDVLGFLEHVDERWGPFDGVTSSSDYPGATVAAAIASRLDLPGARPDAVLRCSHKHASRLLQAVHVPEAVPAVTLVDSTHPAAVAGEIRYPVFVKPVKGAFSVLSRRIDGPDELIEFLSRGAVTEFTGDYMRVFDRLIERFTDLEVGGRFFLAEELLHGRQVTVEGFCRLGEVELLGIVDSLMAGPSFVGFVYPSEIPKEVQWRMAEIARRLMKASGLDQSLFNVEMIWDPDSGRLAVIEVNPRMCGQFADLYEKVDGTNGYEVALALAAGERPRLRRRAGRHAVAASWPLRTFEPARVTRAPEPEELEAVVAAYPDALVWSECEPGWVLGDFDRFEDGFSCRYGVVNVGASDREGLARCRDEIVARLGFELEPL
jgi:hypothetical protein